MNCIELCKQRRSVDVASYDAADNTVALIWSTGAVVRRRGPSGPYDEALRMEPGAWRLERLNQGGPLLNSHSDRSLEDVLGVVIPGSAKIEGGNGVARVRLSTAPGDQDNVIKIRTGLCGVSVGYVIHRIQVAERDGDVPLWTALDIEAVELSCVPIPADPGAQIRSHDDQRATTFPCLIGTSAAATNSRPWERTFCEPFDHVVIPR